MARIPTDVGKLRRVNLLCQGALEIFVVQTEELLGEKKFSASLKKSVFCNEAWNWTSMLFWMWTLCNQTTCGKLKQKVSL